MRRPTHRSRLVVAAAVAVAALAASLTPSLPSPLGRATAEASPAVGSRCRSTEVGRVRIDSATGTLVQCTAGADGRRWAAAPAGARSSDLDPTGGAAAGTTPTTAVGTRFQRTTNPPGPRPGERCRLAEGSRRLSPVTAQLMACTNGTWTPIDPGSQALPEAPPLEPLPPPSVPANQSLPFDACTDGGLPAGVSMPPGATVLPGYPEFRDTYDATKRRRCVVGATLDPGTDLETVHAWFVQQCATLGWRFDARTVERLPTSPPPGPSFKDGTRMLLAECRTRAGSATDRRKRTPWYLSWSVTKPARALPTDPDPPVQLLVEVRDTSRIGGRPAG